MYEYTEAYSHKIEEALTKINQKCGKIVNIQTTLWDDGQTIKYHIIYEVS